MSYIVIENVSRSYRADGVQTSALSGIDLTVGRGEFLCISGPSGSGKTTLLNIIGCLDAPDSGTVQVDGDSLTGLTPRDAALMRRKHFGFVFQSHNLIPVLTAYENVEYVLLFKHVHARERHARTMKALDEVGLSDHVGKRPNQMSVGQQQRIAVARAIVGAPPIVLADEPTASLDTQTGESLLELFKRLNKNIGTTFIFSSHDPRIIERAERIVTLVDGSIV